MKHFFEYLLSVQEKCEIQNINYVVQKKLYKFIKKGYFRSKTVTEIQNIRMKLINPYNLITT